MHIKSAQEICYFFWRKYLLPPLPLCTLFSTLSFFRRKTHIFGFRDLTPSSSSSSSRERLLLRHSRTEVFSPFPSSTHFRFLCAWVRGRGTGGFLGNMQFPGAKNVKNTKCGKMSEFFLPSLHLPHPFLLFSPLSRKEFFCNGKKGRREIATKKERKLG